MSLSRVRRRNAATLAFVFATVLLAGSAAAQSPAASPHGNLDTGVGDVPAGEGAIRGRVVHRVDGRGAGDLPIRLFSLGHDGRPGMRDQTTTSDGAFRFESLSTDPGTVYLVLVQYDEIPFTSRIAFGPGESERTTEIEIADTRSDGTAIEVAAVRVRLDRGCTGVRVTETHVLRNPTNFVLNVPTGEREAQSALYWTKLPEPPAVADSATPGRSMPEGSLEQRGDTIAFFGPLHPGEHAVEFSYSVSSDAGLVALERRFERPIAAASVLTFESAPVAQGASLRRGADVTIDGRRYAALERGPLAPGTPLAFEWDVRETTAHAARLSVQEATMWLELDDAALDVREQYAFDVSGGAPLRTESDAPLLCLPLPAGAEGLRFSAEAFAMGIEPAAGGALALRGPIPPGRSGFALSYLLRSEADGVRFDRAFGTHLSRLSIFIADTGVLATTDRLHRRRPARTSDRSFIHLEGFEIDADETVRVDLAALEPRQPLPRGAAVGFVTAAALLSVVFLIAPLRTPRSKSESAGEAEAEVRVGEREAVYAAIRDLDDDFETGKISDADHAVMLAELRATAAELVRQEREGDRPATPAVDTASATCARCQASLAADARFCSQCGTPVTAPPANPEASA